jgi:hypothetical protein
MPQFYSCSKNPHHELEARDYRSFSEPASTFAERQRANAMAILSRTPLVDFSKSFLILPRVNRPDQSRVQQ